jgi:hypothetical protein
MKKIITLILLCSLSLISNANISNKAKSAEPTNSNDRLIAHLYGQWEGPIEYQYFENATFNKKYSQPFKIEIMPNSIEFYNKNDTGEWVKVRKEFINHFKFSVQKNTLVGHFLNSGEDEDGVWVESQTMYITLKDEKSILIYSIRSVNNTGVTDSIPNLKWNEIGVGELKKDNP